MSKENSMTAEESLDIEVSSPNMSSVEFPVVDYIDSINNQYHEKNLHDINDYNNLHLIDMNMDIDSRNSTEFLMIRVNCKPYLFLY